MRRALSKSERFQYHCNTEQRGIKMHAAVAEQTQATIGMVRQSDLL